MVDLSDNLGFVGVQRIEDADIALGGNEINTPNLQNKQLASRDRFIYDLIAGDPVAQATFENFKQDGIAGIARGRLTLETGVAVSLTDQKNKTILHYTPYNGDFIALWNASENRWDLRQFTEISLSLAGFTANRNYDIFAYWDGSQVQLDHAIWDTSTPGVSGRDPATDISQKNGVWVKTLDNRRFLGTIRLTLLGEAEDSNQNRLVWNVQNRVPRLSLKQMLGIGQYFYSSAAWRAANNSAIHQIGVVTGLPQMIRVDAGLNSDPSGASARADATCGIGWNSLTSNSGQLFASRPRTDDQVMIYAFANLSLGPAYHYFQLLERGGTDEGFWGEDPTDYGTSGIMSIWEA